MLYYKVKRGGQMAPASKAQQRAVHKYVKNNYDRIELTVPKGKKERIRAAAESAGKSLNGYINEAIDEKMQTEQEA